MSLRRKSKLARSNPRDPFEAWRERVQSETDPDVQEALVEFGIAEGYCDASGRVLDPKLSPMERSAAEFNATIRRQAGRSS